jgi:hypothetical protein
MCRASQAAKVVQFVSNYVCHCVCFLASCTSFLRSAVSTGCIMCALHEPSVSCIQVAVPVQQRDVPHVSGCKVVQFVCSYVGHSVCLLPSCTSFLSQECRHLYTGLATELLAAQCSGSASAPVAAALQFQEGFVHSCCLHTLAAGATSPASGLHLGTAVSVCCAQVRQCYTVCNMHCSKSDCVLAARATINSRWLACWYCDH